jgi:hypothetical protein
LLVLVLLLVTQHVQARQSQKVGFQVHVKHLTSYPSTQL